MIPRLIETFSGVPLSRQAQDYLHNLTWPLVRPLLTRGGNRGSATAI